MFDLIKRLTSMDLCTKNKERVYTVHQNALKQQSPLPFKASNESHMLCSSSTGPYSFSQTLWPYAFRAIISLSQPYH